MEMSIQAEIDLTQSESPECVGVWFIKGNLNSSDKLYIKRGSDWDIRVAAKSIFFLIQSIKEVQISTKWRQKNIEQIIEPLI